MDRTASILAKASEKLGRRSSSDIVLGSRIVSRMSKISSPLAWGLLGAGTLAAGGAAVGYTGSKLGSAIANRPKKAWAKRRQEMMQQLEMAAMNRQKALADSDAMRAFSSSGLARAPYERV